jgi:hypothetical protein
MADTKAFQPFPIDRSPSSKHYDDETKSEGRDGVVEDSAAAGYTDKTVHLDEAENARLLRKIHWQ